MFNTRFLRNLRNLIFFFTVPSTTEIYTLSLHDALPIYRLGAKAAPIQWPIGAEADFVGMIRSEEHTSELQSRPHLVCRLLLEKKKNWRERHQPFWMIKFSAHRKGMYSTRPQWYGNNYCI